MRVSPEDAMRRGQYGEERYEKLEFQSKVAFEFDKLFAELNYCIRIDAGKDIEEVAAEISEAVNKIDISQPLGTLW